MAQIIRMIWRLDYEVSYAYLDKRGAALNAMSNTVEKFWESLGDGTVHSSYVGNTTKEGSSRFISLEPNSLNGDIEWTAGTELKSVLRDPSFRGTNSVVNELLKVCDIRSVVRAGLRLFCISKFADGKRGRDRIITQLDDHVRSLASASLGPIDDVGFILEGTTADNIGYRANFGPYAEKNVLMSLRNKPNSDNLKVMGEADLFFDIDLFETNFSFSEHSLFRWAETKVAKGINFIAKYSGDFGKSKK